MAEVANYFWLGVLFIATLGGVVVALLILCGILWVAFVAIYWTATTIIDRLRP